MVEVLISDEFNTAPDQIFHRLIRNFMLQARWNVDVGIMGTVPKLR